MGGVMLDRIEFVIEEAIIALKRNGLVTISAINTTAIALLILGGLAQVYLSLTDVLTKVSKEYELSLSIEGDSTKEEVAKMKKQILAIDGVANVTYLEKEKAWKQFLVERNLEEFTEDLENPLPDQFFVTLTSLDKADSVKAKLAKLPFVSKKDEIRDASVERVLLVGVMRFVKIFGGLLTLFAFFTAGVLIYNSVSLTVNARRQEIRIMQLMGASRGVIRMPFILEGCFQGVLGGLLAGFMLWVLSTFVASLWHSWVSIGGTQVEKSVENPLGMWLLAWLVVIGGFLGILSAVLSVRRYLRVGI